MRSIKLSLAIASPLTVLIATSGCSHQSGASASTSPTNDGSSAVVDRVVAGPPTRKTLVLTTTQPARIEAFEVTPLFAKLAGYVGEVRVDIGDAVTKDQPLIVLHIPELQNEVAQKQAYLQQAEAEVQQAAANTDATRAAAETAAAQVAEAQAGIAGARADAERWTAELNRIKQLALSGSVTQKLVDESANRLAAAKAASQKAVAAVASAEAGAREATALVAKAEADNVAAEARLGVARADLARAETMLNYAILAAPFDGVVTQRAVDNGHFVQPAGGAAARPLLTVARTDKVRVSLEVSELEANQVDVGDLVTLNIQALAGEPVQGSITRTSWSLDPANRSLRAEIDLPNINARLRPGLYATAAIELARRENVLTAPATAIIRVEQQTLVNEVQSGKIVRRPVKLGLRSGSEVEILEGLDERANIVQIRGESLIEGQAVEVINPKAP
jgi:RND family efflux transporter MFP subunit